jgi:hypothetical protein
MPYSPIYLTTSEAESATSKISWCWSDSDGVYDQARLLEDLESIEGEVTAYVSVRYNTPVVDTLGIQQLKGYVVVLLRSRGYGRHPVANTPESVLQEARQTRGQLRDISSGAMLLGQAAQRTDGVRAESIGGVYDSARFKRASMAGWG